MTHVSIETTNGKTSKLLKNRLEISDFHIQK